MTVHFTRISFYDKEVDKTMRLTHTSISNSREMAMKEAYEYAYKIGNEFDLQVLLIEYIDAYKDGETNVHIQR